MSVHDPEKTIHLLRANLAAHDRRLVFLFGAGTSSAVNVAPPPSAGSKPDYVPLVPAVAELTHKCKESVASISPAHGEAWNALETECDNMALAPTIESILGRLRLKIEAANPSDTPLGLALKDLRLLESTIRVTVATAASPEESAIPEQLPHDGLARWIRHAERIHPIEIFTTNYDVLLERSLELAKVPFFDGFVGSYQPYFSPDSLDDERLIPGHLWTRIWKMHGSTNWRLKDRVPVRLTSTGEESMILPSYQKYDESRKMPYVALMDRFVNVLAREGTLLVTCGYSWSDEHINASILTALDAHPANAAVALIFGDGDDVPALVKFAEDRKNLLVVARDSAVLQGIRLPWALPHIPDSATAQFLDLTFDSNAIQEESIGPVPGEMRLGDFHVLCKFLEDMNREPVP